MKLNSNQFLKACSLSLALIGSTAIIATLATPDYAYAKNGKGGGNGGGNGNSGGGHGADKSDGGKTSGKAAGNSRKKSKSSRGGAKKFNSKGFSLKNLFGGKKKRSAIKSTNSSTAKVKRSATKPSKSLLSTHASVVKGKIKDGLHPSQLGNMNGAINSSPNAKLAHIRNGNFQGPVGLAASLALADYDYRLDIELFNDAQSVVELAAAFEVLETTTEGEIDVAQEKLDLARALVATEVLETDPDNAEALAIVEAYETEYGKSIGDDPAPTFDELVTAKELLDDVEEAEDLTEGEEEPTVDELAAAQVIYDEGEPSTGGVVAAEDALLDAWNKGSREDENADEVLAEVRNSLPTDEEIANILPDEEEDDDVSIDAAETEIIEVIPDTTSGDAEES